MPAPSGPPLAANPDAEFEALRREQAPRRQWRLCARLRSPENVRDAVQDAFARLLDDTDHINLAIID